MSRMGSSDLIDVRVFVHAETVKAVLVSEDGDHENSVWLPKSQVEIENDLHGRTATITLPEWLAMDKGLI